MPKKCSVSTGVGGESKGNRKRERRERERAREREGEGKERKERNREKKRDREREGGRNAQFVGSSHLCDKSNSARCISHELFVFACGMSLGRG